MHIFLKLIGLSEGATDDEIKSAYRRKILSLHPDRNASVEATAQTQALCAAKDSYQKSRESKSRRIELSQVFSEVEVSDAVFKLVKVMFFGVSSSDDLVSSKRFFQFLKSRTGEQASTYLDTVGIDLTKYLIHCPESHNPYIKMQSWITAGQERFKSITKASYRGANALVFFLTDDPIVQGWLEQCLYHNNPDIKKIIIGHRDILNKCPGYIEEKRSDIIWIPHDIVASEYEIGESTTTLCLPDTYGYDDILSSLLTAICDVPEDLELTAKAEHLQTGNSGVLQLFKMSSAPPVSLENVLEKLRETRAYFIRTKGSYPEEKTSEKLLVINSIEINLKQGLVISDKQLQIIRAGRSINFLGQYKDSSQGTELEKLIIKYQLKSLREAKDSHSRLRIKGPRL